MNNSQLLKGILDGCVLEIVKRKEIYGYDLIKELQEAGFSEIKGGTVYPLLTKLEKKQLIKGETKPSTDGPNRKYFTITEDGEKHLLAFKNEWQDLTEIVNRIISEGAKQNENG